MGSHIPIKPNREDAHSSHHADLHERVLEGKDFIIGTEGRIVVSWKGDRFVIDLAKQVSSGGSVTLDITGEWDPNRSYKFMEIAIISVGLNAGTFVYINQTPSSGHAPYVGGGWWIQLPLGQTGAWM